MTQEIHSRCGRRYFWIIAVSILGVLAGLFLQEYFQLNVLGSSESAFFWNNIAYRGFRRLLFGFLVGWLALLAIALRIPKDNFSAMRKGQGSVWLRRGLATILLPLPALLIFMRLLPSGFSDGYWTHALVLFLAALLTTLILSDADADCPQLIRRLAFHLLLCAVLFAIAARFSLISSYPFSLYWSEGNRFYDYSSLLGDFRYQTAGAMPVKAFITPGMALPWGIPFAFPRLSIGFYRFYYQLVWIIPALLVGLFAFRRTDQSQSDWLTAAVFGLWAYLFIEQGPIYSPLVISAIGVVFALRARRGVDMLLVFSASLYAHYSRWTWSFAPGIWAAMLAVVALNAGDIRANWKRALLRPLLLGAAGLMGGLLLPAMLGSEMTASLINPLPFAGRQPLLWERLLPNSTYPPGILLGIFWAAVPALAVALIVAARYPKERHWLQMAAIGLPLMGFLAIGIIASAKIGGGSNLHNLDMILLTIVLLFAPVAKRIKALWDSAGSEGDLVLALCLLLAVCGPVAYTLQQQPPMAIPAVELVEDALLHVRTWAERSARKGEVLFIDQRQLLTFAEVTNVPLVQEYEKKMLMEMAMSGRTDYFAEFYRDLMHHRFTLIVNEPSGLFIKGEETAFSEENNAYVEWVTLPLLCNYYPVYTAKSVGLELLLPRTILPVEEPQCAPYLLAGQD